MVEVFVPFVLILMSWSPDDPQGSMQVTQRVYIDEETCLAAGREREEAVAQHGVPGREFVWRCEEQITDIEVYRPIAPSE
ncbi:hypothetical protein [Aurantiacibacter aquimixticola]|uniref:DUF4242 domain-containing protein n=1 Tax=Aurantiacibacter aquimixticola TaxID=1958945 RepID=A0A419RSN6_9SPHN|nr:hypothetical protein [Aurantiacibacter aquimixticola]RJY08754.1 hypothetical protein D6201_04725 [Aurantiacibacter aquimixticola]